MKTYLLSVILFLIAFGLGYPTLNRYDPSKLNALSDSAIYSKIVATGTIREAHDHRAMRTLVPFAARGLYILLKNSSSTWNPIMLSLLIVNALFCSLTSLILYKISDHVLNCNEIGLLSSFLFLLNFSTPNLLLSGLIDSSATFSLLLLAYLLLKKKWAFLPLVSIIGIMSKETFILSGLALAFIWYLYDCVKNRKLLIRRLLWIAISFIICSLYMIVVAHYVFGNYITPWHYAGSFYDNNYQSALIQRPVRYIAHMLYPFIWLLPTSIFGIKEIPRPWLLSAGITALLFFTLTLLIGKSGASGAAIGRYMFNITGPMLTIASAKFFHKTFGSRKKILKNSS